MFSLAILIGVYSYLIFALGILHILNIKTVLLVSLLFIGFCGLYLYKNVKFKKIKLNFKDWDIISFILIFIFFIQVLVNLIGVLGPELGFDALWYHLTLPKLYILNNLIFHIPGNLLYYSNMPKLTEMLYLVGLLFGNEIVPKLIHFSFGLLCCFSIFKILRKYVSVGYALLGMVVFYSSLVVAWQSITAYIDLSRTFFELMALWGFLNFAEKKEKKWLIESAIMLGLAISTKIIAVGNLLIFLFLIGYFLYSSRFEFKKTLNLVLLFSSVSLFVPLPWFVLSFINTGNPFYPVLSKLYPIGFSFKILNPTNIINDLFTIFTKADDPISPIYLIFVPLLFIYYKKLNKYGALMFLYSILAVFIWYITPRTGGGRFILPYLPAFSILTILTLSVIKNKFLQRYLVILIIAVSISSLGYRGIANSKYLSVILGKETRSSFLTKNLNFSFGDFYDTDGYLKKNIKKNDKVLLYGFHNLYYVNFPFLDSSWVKPGDKFNYIAVQNLNIPKRFYDWDLIYYNPQTKVSLYSKGGIFWFY